MLYSRFPAGLQASPFDKVRSASSTVSAVPSSRTSTSAPRSGPPLLLPTRNRPAGSQAPSLSRPALRSGSTRASSRRPEPSIEAASFDGAYALRLATKIGETVPLYSTAVGKAVLGTLPENEWARFLPPEPFPTVTPHTHQSLADLRVDVLEARSRGCAGDEEESELSGVCVAAAIRGRDGRPVAAISVTSVAGRLPVEARAPLGRSVQRWCEQISAELRGRMRRDPTEETGAPARLELVSPAQARPCRRS